MLHYAGAANALLEMLLPVVLSRPLIPPGLTETLAHLERLTQQIIDIQTGTRQIITDVRTGLQIGEVSKQHDHAVELQSPMRSRLAILPKQRCGRHADHP